MLSLQEMSDRFELQDLTNRYCHLLDQGLFEELRQVFTDDACIDYTAMGGIKGNPDDVVSFLKQVMPRFANYQHMITNQQFDIDDDKAAGRIMCLNPMEPVSTSQDSSLFFLGFWYVDEYVRTDHGWRISSRVEEKSYQFNR
ncbi:hypothetical protein A9Q99_25010 [Gammaproteobacteria bacterium 45_16_T64]|nr:hypothetical protein A9Q99_25010 [Gammaproteobacteria bacterium 45_16_T64]